MSMPMLNPSFFANPDDYYVILDVDKYASPETVAHAYRNLARRYHPDKNNQDDRSRREAQIIFERVKTAYEVLSDPRKRKIYDTLGPDGLKLDGWILSEKRLTAKEIREEYLRLQETAKDEKLARIAKPRSSFTMSIDASEVFSQKLRDDDDLDDLKEELGIQPESSSRLANTGASIVERLSSIEISSMSASMAVDQYLSADHSVVFDGNLSAQNGTGEGALGINYKYKHSPETKFDVAYEVGRGPRLMTGVTHQLNKRTSLYIQSGLYFRPYTLFAPAFTFRINHTIRDNLKGRVTYTDGIHTSVSTALVYVNEALLFEVTVSHKLSDLYQSASIEFGYRFNEDRSRLQINLIASSKEGLAIEYGCETTVLEFNVISAALSFSVPSGVTLKLRYVRARQEFNLPIYLSDEVHTGPLFYGTMVPLIAYYLLDRYYLRHCKKLHG